MHLLEERLQRDEGPDGFVPDERVNDDWLALAALQVESGRVTPGVLSRTLAIVGSDEELDRWFAEDRPERARALDGLAAAIRAADTAPPPALPQRVRRRLRRTRRRLGDLSVWPRLLLTGLAVVAVFLLLRALLPADLDASAKYIFMGYAALVVRTIHTVVSERRRRRSVRASGCA